MTRLFLRLLYIIFDPHVHTTADNFFHLPFKILHSIKIVLEIDYAHIFDRVSEINIFQVGKNLVLSGRGAIQFFDQ